ncbi:MAG: hypothetical protein COA52_15165 [Hyphomicrobiales bacterium]|nr:MAG: hypothetical protein COA52_15165 [Hyphomicrobiales bacterium]
MVDETPTHHASCVVLDGHGLLIKGPSGSGKSQLALALIQDAGAQLVADDRVALTRHHDQLIAQAPKPLQGLIERYGMGIETHEFLKSTPLALVVDLVPRDKIERMPEPDALVWPYLELSLPRLILPAQPINAISAIRAALAKAVGL